MLDFEADLAAVFFCADFAMPFTRQRPLASDVEVLGILGVTEGDALDTHAIAITRSLRLPSTADVRADDVLVAVQAIPAMGVEQGARFRVLDLPQRVNDGMEFEALLGSVGP